MKWIRRNLLNWAMLVAGCLMLTFSLNTSRASAQIQHCDLLTSDCGYTVVWSGCRFDAACSCEPGYSNCCYREHGICYEGGWVHFEACGLCQVNP